MYRITIHKNLCKRFSNFDSIIKYWGNGEKFSNHLVSLNVIHCGLAMVSGGTKEKDEVL